MSIEVVWLDITGEVMVTDENEVLGTKLFPLSVPRPPPTLKVADDPWATVEEIILQDFDWSNINGQRQLFTRFWQDSLLYPPEDEAVETYIYRDKNTNKWKLERYLLPPNLGEWKGEKNGMPEGPEGEYAKTESTGDPDPAPATLTVARA